MSHAGHRISVCRMGHILFQCRCPDLNKQRLVRTDMTCSTCERDEEVATWTKTVQLGSGDKISLVRFGDGSMTIRHEYADVVGRPMSVRETPVDAWALSLLIDAFAPNALAAYRAAYAALGAAPKD